MSRRLLSLWLPYWRTTLWHKAHPQRDPALPLVLYGREKQGRKIVSANEAALLCGIQPGQMLAMARSLVPDLASEPVAPERDAQALRRLAEWCRRFSPLVAVDAADGLWIDTTGCAHLFGGESAMLVAMEAALASHGHQIRAAIANTAGAAHALARFGSETLTVLSGEHLVQALDPLPIAALRLTREENDRLHGLGITRIADLRAVPRAALTRRFGVEPARQLDYALGRQKEPLRFDHPVVALQATRHLLEPIGTAESIMQVMQVLTQEIASLLQKKGLGARRFDLVCHRVDDMTQATRIGTSAPINDPERLYRLLQERIETIDPGFGIERMSLHVEQAERCVPVPAAGDLAGSGQEEKTQVLDLLAERLRNRAGLHAVYYLGESDAPFPEAAQQRLAAPSDMNTPSLWPRPTRVFTQPCPIVPPDLAEDFSPKRFRWYGKTLSVCGADGPERLHGAWWQNPLQAGAIRDYWIVEVESGERFWLFRNGDGVHRWSGDGAWFVHGLF
ncbi:DNA polymerase Y family protein [Asaia siamensis]